MLITLIVIRMIMKLIKIQVAVIILMENGTNIIMEEQIALAMLVG